MRVRDPRLLVVLSAALLGAAIAFPLGVIASHQFTDVPDSNTFHDDVAAIAAAGVTTGCAAGKYCPKDFVTREQMAAFLNRLGALEPGKTPVVNAATAEHANMVDGLDSEQFARSDLTATGHYNCGADDMHPQSSDVQYASGGLLSTTAPGPATFTCGIHLPDGATITALRATLIDAHEGGLAMCRLFRWPMQANAPGFPPIAETPSTGDVATPGFVIVEDDTILTAVVDNAAYSYYGSCFVNAANTLFIQGLQVVYEVTGLPIE